MPDKKGNKRSDENTSFDISEEVKSALRNDLLGSKEWKQSKLGWLFGVSSLMNSARAGVGFLVQPAKVTYSVGRKFFSPWTVERLQTNSSDESERFRVGVAQHYRTKRDIALDINATSKWFSIYFVVLALVLAYNLASMSSAGTGFLPLWAAITTKVALIPGTLALLAQVGFHNWQLRTARLGSFREYVMSPSQWFAEPATESGKGNGGGGVSRLASMLLIAGGVSFGAWAGLSPSLADSVPPNTPGSPVSTVTGILTTPPTTDLWVAMLTYLFPGIGPLGPLSAVTASTGLNAIGIDGQITSMQTAFGSFLAVLMALSSVALAYFTVVGMISTAHEGKVLGQKWHTFYAPVRVVTGFAMLVPVVKGFCLAQVMVIYLAVWGGSFGNLIWNAYIQSLSVPPTAQAYMPQVMPLMRDVMLIQTCRAAALENFRSMTPITTLDTSTPVIGQTEEVQAGQLLLNWFNGSGQGSTPVTASQNVPAANASVQWVNAPGSSPYSSNSGFGDAYLPTGSATPASGTSTPSIPSWSASTKQQKVLSYGDCGSLTLDATISDTLGITEYDTALMAAVVAYSDSIFTSVQKVVKTRSASQNATNTTFQASEFDTAAGYVKTFHDALTTAQTNLQSKILNSDNFTNIKAGIMQWGWAASGSYYMVISKFHEQFATNTSRLPSVKLGSLYESYANQVQNPGVVKNLMPAVSAFWMNVVAKSPGIDRSVVALAGIGGSSSGVSDGSETLSDVLQAPALRATLSMLEVDLSKGSGLDHLVRFGHALLTTWTWIVSALLLVIAAKSIFGNLFGLAAVASGTATGGAAGAIAGGLAAGLTSIMTYLGGIFQAILAAILLAGLLHAYVLPMIPYIIMMFFVIGMITLVVEGMVAAPLWAFFHIRPDGQEFVEQVQRPGYMILFNLLLRIPLAMFGLLFSYLVIDILMWFEGVTFIPAFLGATSTSGYSVYGIVTAFLMLGYLHWQICIRAFGLITHLPDKVTRWFGQAGEQLGEGQHSDAFVGGMVRHVNQKATAMNASGVASQIIGGQGRGGQTEATGVQPNAGTQPANQPSAQTTPASQGTAAAAGRAPAAAKPTKNDQG